SARLPARRARPRLHACAAHRPRVGRRFCDYRSHDRQPREESPSQGRRGGRPPCDDRNRARRRLSRERAPGGDGGAQMMRLAVVSVGAIGLILLVAFVTQRLIRARTAGMSIRMQIFLALAGIVGAFALGVGLLVLDRIEARATLLATEAARDEAEAIARFVGAEMRAGSYSIEDIAGTLQHERLDPNLHLLLLDTSGRVVFGSGEREPGTVVVQTPIAIDGRVLGSIRVIKPTIIMRRLLADFAPTILVISVTLGAA